MALEFTSDAEGELLMSLDEKGLSDLMATLAAALKTGEPQLIPVVRNSPGAFGEVTVVFRRRRRPRRPVPGPRPAEGMAYDLERLRR